jgi:hypothetical protein
VIGGAASDVGVAFVQVAFRNYVMAGEIGASEYSEASAVSCCAASFGGV